MPPNSRGVCGAHRPAACALARSSAKTIQPDVLVLVPRRPVGFDRHDDLVHEFAGTALQPLEFGIEGKVHGIVEC